MAYLIRHNNPQVGFISWENVNMQYNGTTYPITDGFTDMVYTWWEFTDPYVFKSSNTFPTLTAADALVLLNKNGTAVLVPGATILDGSLIVPGSILADALSANSVTGEKILAGSIDSTHISAGAIEADHLAAYAVTAGAIAADAVGAQAIAAGAILAEHISVGAITTDKIVAGAITGEKIAAETILANNIAANAITGDKIAANTITADKINVTDLSAISGEFTSLMAGTSGGARLEMGDAAGTPYLDMYDSYSKLRVELQMDKVAFYDEIERLGGGVYSYRYNDAGYDIPLLELETDYWARIMVSPTYATLGDVPSKAAILQMFCLDNEAPELWLRSWSVYDGFGDVMVSSDIDLSPAEGHAVQLSGRRFYEGRFSATISSTGWYRIAVNYGNRANAEFVLKDVISGGGHSCVRFIAGTSYNEAAGISVSLLNHSKFGSVTFTDLRILTNTTYDTQYLEVWINRTGDVVMDIFDNSHYDGWEPVNFETGSVPTGYTEHRYVLSNMFLLGSDEWRFAINRSGHVAFNPSAESGKIIKIDDSISGGSGTEPVIHTDGDGFGALGNATYPWWKVYTWYIYRNTEYSLSDERLKENIVAADKVGKISSLRQMDIKEYNFISTRPNENMRRRIGPMAQQVDSFFTDEDRVAINVDNVLWTAVAGIQELFERVERLEAAK